MCGIVAGIANHNIVNMLSNGLSYLEYRGYDSAGISIIDKENKSLVSYKQVGKVRELKKLIPEDCVSLAGIAHTRWATHGKPSKSNSHPHTSNNSVAVVHNGIIENFMVIKTELINLGYNFESDTDTEVIAHLIHHNMQENKCVAVAINKACKQLSGSYALAIIALATPNKIYAVCNDSPLVIGLSESGNFLASDQIALLEVSKEFIYLKSHQTAILQTNGALVYDILGNIITPKKHTIAIQEKFEPLGEHKHFMHKEIHEQQQVANKIIQEYFHAELSSELQTILSDTKKIHIAACGTSYHAAMLAKYWIEDLAGIPVAIHIASEYRHHQPPHEEKTIFICISQSGETADTLAALRLASSSNRYTATITICNSTHSTITREADICLPMLAGKEIGVASTKAFTAQALCLLSIANNLSSNKHTHISKELELLPSTIANTLALEDKIKDIAKTISNAKNIMVLGRNSHYPIALEGALKLKEITYIHTEAYASGELKHGPIALIDKDIVIIALIPRGKLLQKNISNVQEIAARGGNIICIIEEEFDIDHKDSIKLMLPSHGPICSVISYTIALQLLSYHTANFKGNDVDQPRNLAKSVTVE
jgi:glutamine---fructose-6-phosphate transaminase (isomerizing)